MFGNALNKTFWFVLMLAFAQTMWAGSRYALVVGIGDYPASRKLDGSVRDAVKFTEFLTANKFTEIKTLTDKQATRKAILDGFAYFQNKTKPGDVFYFYFAGHGTIFLDSKSDDRDELFKIKSGINPVTKKPFFPEGEYDSAICPYDHKEKNSARKWGNIILDDELFDEFEKIADKGGFSVLISDSCHSGTLGRTLENRSFRFLFPDEAYDQTENDNVSDDQSVQNLKKITLPKSQTDRMNGKYFALTAAADNQLAEEKYFDSVNGEMGVFTYYLLEILTENPSITLNNLLAELNKRVLKKNDQQTVHLEKRFLNGDLEKIKLLSPQ